MDRGVNEETMPTIWGTDWYNLWCSWSLYHTLDPTRHDESMVKIWRDDCNIQSIVYKVK